ncbi:Glycosyltransferase involved in cell wall bisynthesis [Algoriphagus ornithinivorans]|uniref:Glycosyltransferase involved in cell wall bisynthesis n=1 Tax=Algoriphagus ornithinivorans TaxID=226506 RepID=A0A1I5HH52_9BACT|nr:glycosyltransferase family 4 protein [Algoriphagus ornithinivorans]SFO47678.1 Glycosyltransferase involved in cell wall bisynthesis [Algoriphagus ornithinivorans]
MVDGNSEFTIQNSEFKKILFLPKYPHLGASSRLRTYQYLALWDQEGLDYQVSSFFNEPYLKRFYLGKRHHPFNLLFCYFRRFWILLGAWRYDLIYIEKELFPFLPSYAEWVLEKLGKGYVVDYDDAVFHNYDSHSNPLIRSWMGDKISWVMRHSHLVFAGNSYLKSYAEEAGAERVIILPTVIRVEKYPIKTTHNLRKVSIGWIGSPTTLKYLLALEPVFRRLGNKHDLELLVINAANTILPDLGIPTRLIPWEEHKEGNQISDFDIGIMPLPDDDWERGKCAYKLIQYMACALPVVAAPVGMNQDVVQHGINGYLAGTEQEWVDYLEKLILDPQLRQDLGKNGRALVEEKYIVEKNFQIIKKAILSLNKA